MSTFSQITRTLMRTSKARSVKSTVLPSVPIARLHQQGPSRSAVVHEPALPQSQGTVSSQAGQSPFYTPTQTPSKSQSKTASSDESALDALISQMPLVQSLRQSRKTYKESRPHLLITPAIRQHHFVGGSLAGSGKLTLAPYMWTSSKKSESESGSGKSTRASSVVSVFHIGRDLCGHPGFVHGGLLSVLFDEVFARCVSAAFPSGLGMTANLNVDFRKPALPDRLYVLRAQTTKVEGRKAWVEGKMTYVPLALSLPVNDTSIAQGCDMLSEDNGDAVMVSEARALFVEPKFADSMVSVYRT
ncbi:hypothetical protein N7539_001017 [Penicillium diatomitis]|uniref:Thioesterase domain-containing protein n=1 Tax=Penicillium diatomitis TaxID=2819901 RepID=A0A9W9XMV9_9EURO|nr:uncharacterized protein N7539_001017 [Penicillium diatomitis]KAJ5495901.1 hypothetical protein N7539_001017 [Penicillium diatomitis]